MYRVVNPIDEIRKLSSSRKSEYKRIRCELREGDTVVAVADAPAVLIKEKARMVYYGEVRCPELLKVYFDGVQWIFDSSMTKKEASRILAEDILWGHC